MKAFVTGSTGLLGTNLVRALLARGHEVIALARDTAKAARLLTGKETQVVIGDMRRVETFASALEGCDAVFHGAAHVRETVATEADRQALDTVNVRGTMALLEASEFAGVACFVHVGSAGAVGRKSDGSPGDEQTPPSKVQRANPYLQSKLRAQAALSACAEAGAMRVIEILPGWIWGPYDEAPTAAGRMLGQFEAGGIPFLVDGGTSIVDARDVADAMIVAAGRAAHGTRYITGGHYVSMAQLLAALERVTSVPAPRRRIPHAVVMAYAACAEVCTRMLGREALVTREAVRLMHACIALDSGRAERELGLRFRPLEETLHDAWTWRRNAQRA